MPYNSNSNSTFYTIIWLSKESLESWNQPEFALISERSNWLGNSLKWVLIDFWFEVYNSDKYWSKLQAVFDIIEDGKNTKLKVNMSSAIRSIINKLATQDKIGTIIIELLNTTSKDWTRRPWTIVYNNWNKIVDRMLQNDDESIEHYTDKKTWKNEKIYHSIPDRNEKWYDSQYFDIIIGKRLKEIVAKNKFIDNTKEEDLPF